MIKKTGVLLVICCFFIAAMPNAAPAAQPLARQSLAKKNIAGLKDKLLAAAQDDSTPLHALSVQFLDDLQRVGFKKNTADLELAVRQYVADVTEQTEATALDTSCAPALLISITLNGSSMIQKVMSGDAPVCTAISLSTSVASIISAERSYEICALENTPSADPAQDDAKIAAWQQQQKVLKIYSFAANVLNLGVCTVSIGFSDYVNILVQLIGLFA